LELAGYHLYHAARADLLRRRGDVDGAVAAYGHARARTDNVAERRFIDRRLRTLLRTEWPG
jgi:RNA polymerase sigma-70 factor (ECF subfamily)